MPGVASSSPHHGDHALPEVAETEPARLTVIVPIIDEIDCRTGEQANGIVEVQPTLRQSSCPLVRVVAEFHTAVPRRAGALPVTERRIM